MPIDESSDLLRGRDRRLRQAGQRSDDVVAPGEVAEHQLTDHPGMSQHEPAVQQPSEAGIPGPEMVDPDRLADVVPVEIRTPAGSRPARHPRRVAAQFARARMPVQPALFPLCPRSRARCRVASEVRGDAGAEGTAGVGAQSHGMRFGLFLPPFVDFAEPRRVVELARTAEDAGWDGLFLWDHMLAGPQTPVADCWTIMAAVAAVTDHMKIGALVTPLARRRPWVLARQIATLDRLSGGRVVAGAGLGDDGWGEFSSFGEETRPAVRAAMLDEALDILERLLSGEPVRYDGQHYAVQTEGFRPRPVQDPVPIWAACRWPNRRPLARAAARQGCFPIFATSGPPPPPDPLDVRAIRQALEDLGTGPRFDLVVRYALSLEDPSRTPDTVGELEEAGATWVLNSFGPGDPPAGAVEEIVRNGPPARP